jgi:predicted Zn finger-like uncharacterized protein
MIVKCPQCDSKYKLDPSKFTSPEPKIRCKKCNTVFKAVEEPAAAPAAPAAPVAPAPAPAAPKAATPPPPAPKPAAAAPAPKPAAAPAAPAAAGGHTVLIAHESEEVTGLAAELLTEAGYHTLVVHDGIQALMEIEGRKPAVAILDVGLPKMFGFEIIEVVRRDAALAGVKLLLIAAIYDKTRYKRNPQSLYGADDYVEKHLIPESVVEKVAALVGGAPAPAAPAPEAAPAAAAKPAAPAPAAPKAAPAPKPAAVPLPPKPAAAPAPASTLDESTLTPEEREDHEKAKRLARIIVSDIALYNAEALTESVRKGNPMEALAGDIEEGRKLFVERVPAAMRGRFDYLGVALEDLFAKKRKELGLAV